MPQTAILGFGNPCRSDDAVGIFVINELKKRILSDNENIRLFDMGTSAFEVLFLLKNYNRFILVDGVKNSGESPGTLFKLPASEIKRAPIEDPLVFLHTIKWDQALSYAKKIMGENYPNDNIDVFLIAIDNTDFQMQMSDVVTQAGIKAVETIMHILQQENHL